VRPNRSRGDRRYLRPIREPPNRLQEHARKLESRPGEIVIDLPNGHSGRRQPLLCKDTNTSCHRATAHRPSDDTYRSSDETYRSSEPFSANRNIRMIGRRSAQTHDRRKFRPTLLSVSDLLRCPQFVRYLRTLPGRWQKAWAGPKRAFRQWAYATLPMRQMQNQSPGDALVLATSGIVDRASVVNQDLPYRVIERDCHRPDLSGWSPVHNGS
jgi:hypothetical protein